MTTATKIKIHQLAKELGVDSKIIIAKLQAEEIPGAAAMTHMTTVPIGLAATIREWFSAHDAASGTAVEVAEKVDLDKVRTKARRARAKTAGEGEPEPAGDAGAAPVSDAGTAVAEPPRRGARKSKPSDSESESGEPPEEGDETLAAPSPAPTAPATAARPMPPTVLEPVALARPPSAPPVTEGPAALPLEPAAITASAPAAPASATRMPVQPPAPVRRPPEHPPGRLPGSAVTPAPQNVPVRPKVVSPAGPKLQVQQPVRLSGPKVVRVEAPEIVDVPRSRRPATGEAGIPISRGPRGGTGVPGAAAEEDRGRSPRRGGGGGGGAAASNKRRPPTPGGVPERRKGHSGGGDAWAAGGGVFSEQDLIEREARLNRAGGFLKKRRQEARKDHGPAERASTPAEVGGKVQIAAPFTIKDLSAATGVKAAEIVKKLFLGGVMATINSPIETSKAQEIMIDYDIELEAVEAKTAEEAVSAEFEQRETVDLRPRGPVVTILGHVDHGKTSLLDKIRNANVAAGEAGGITQKTSAFKVPVKVGQESKDIVFLDTPGHQAFTAMRARGANMTDVVVLVVSPAEGGVMPQTIESINHAKAAKVPIIVAMNKVDRPDVTEAVLQRTYGQLAEHGLNPTIWGGETEVVKTSAVTGQGLPELLETLDYQAQLRNLKADFGGEARGTVIEAKVEEGRGAVANILVQDGVLNVGDFIVVGRGFGRIRDITDDKGRKVKTVVPPSPVQISGIDEVPDAGDKFYVVDSLRKAQDAAEQRRQRERETQLAQPKVTLDSLFTQIADRSTKEILIVLKADVQGSVDALKKEIEKVGTAEVKVRVLHAAVGGITESDVLLADASKGIIVGFNVIPSGKARNQAEIKGVEIRTYDVIYDITDDLKKAAEGLLAPELRQEILGHAEVRQVFKVSKVGSIAGCYVTDGVIQRDALIRVTRSDVVIEKDRKLEQLKRFKDDAKDVRAGMECGAKIVGYDDIKEGDILECYKNVEVKRTL